MTSADFSQFVVTARLLSLKPRLRDLPSYGRTLSGLYPLGLLSAVRIVIGLLLPLQHYPCLTAFYQVLVHRANRLPPASFRFHLTMDTLALAVTFPLSGRFGDLRPLEYVRAGRTKMTGKRRKALAGHYISSKLSINSQTLSCCSQKSLANNNLHLRQGFICVYKYYFLDLKVISV